MTTFDIDNTCKTKYLEILESLKEQAHALKAIHNPQTWRLSALTFALHIHDCIILFGHLKEKWATRLPFSEAWDVDFTEWKSHIWSLVNNVSSFVEETEYFEWKRLCEEDYHVFIEKAKECLLGELPLTDLNDFLSEKNTELKQVIIDSGQDLSSLFSDTETMLYESDATLYDRFYDDLVNISMSENENEYLIDNNGSPMPYARWKASKSQKRLPELILSKIKSASTNMHDTKFWQETWDECFDLDNREIDKEGFARFIFQNRKNIIESKQYPCKNCLGRCFATLCLCEYLWHEYDLLTNLGRTVENNTDLPNHNLSDERQPIFEELMELVDKGDWAKGIRVEDTKHMICNVLGVGEVTMDDDEMEFSEKLWQLLLGGRKGDSGRVRVIWENIVGFLDEKRLFVQKGSPALDKDFFGDSKGYTNIDKGRPGNDYMSNGFREILPLLEKFAPKLPKR